MEIIKAEQYATMVKIFLINDSITLEDLMPVIRKGTSNMLGEPEEKIFKS